MEQVEPAETQKTAVEVKEVTKIYDLRSPDVKALSNVSLRILDNEFFTLLGPSGCGKTTLLRMIAGFEEITEGEIYLHGIEIDTLPPNRRPINTVFQHYALFPHLTVYDNVAFGLRRLGRKDGFIRSRTAEMLELTQMKEFAGRRPSELSGGQQQRVALARALAPEPRVLLLDEPLSALDLKLRQAMREELKQLQQQTGITFIFVTHDQEEALTMSDRICVMSRGEVQQVGAARAIYDHPRNRFVANFVGEANIFTAVVQDGQGQGVALEGENGMTLGGADLGESEDALRSGERVALIIRPERIRLARPAGRDGNVGEIVGKTYLGTDTHYRLRMKAEPELLVRVQNTAGGAAFAAFAVGDGAAVSIDKGAAVLLAD